MILSYLKLNQNFRLKISKYKMSKIKPRLCALKRNEKGYGFHLFGAKDHKGHIIRKVEEGSVAESSGLLVGDRIIEVNSVNVQDMTHKQVICFIR